MAASDSTPEIRYLTRPGQPKLAYRQTPARPGWSGPGLVFLPGFRSDMAGSKALALFDRAAERGHAALLLDYRGHGSSQGAFEDGCIGLWTEDALAVFDAVTTGPQIVVGSSMGGWIAMKLALARPDRVQALVGIAAAPDFTERLLRPSLTAAQRAALAEQGKFVVPSEYDPVPTPYTALLLEDGARQTVLDAAYPFAGAVRLLHGQRDPDVPWQTALDIAAHVGSDDVRVHLIKDGDHRLSREQDLTLLVDVVDELLGN